MPENAPPEYADRNTLWNAVEAVERQWNSQLARRFIMALPRELSREEQIRLMREYCQAQFVSKGMTADFAIHDKGDGNPHAHILLTLRPMDKQGHWLAKCRKEYVLDENGQCIKMKNGEYIREAAPSITTGPLSLCADTVQIKNKSEPVPDGE